MGRWWLGNDFSAMAGKVAIGALVVLLINRAGFAQNQPVAEAPVEDATVAPAEEAPAEETPAVEMAAEQPAADPAAPTDAETEATADEAAGQQTAPPPQAGDFERLEQDFSSFLHFSVIGRFDMAEGIARSLLQHPDLNPLSEGGAQQMLELSEKYENSLDTLLLLINNPQVGDESRKILDIIYESHRRARMDPARIKENLERLAGAPNQQAFALDRLTESGEYAVPWMLEALVDPARARLHPFIVRTLPKLGRPAVNPLVQALSVDNDVIQRFAAQALGRIGYPQALAYLRRLAVRDGENQAVREAATEAIGQIVANDPRLRGLAEASPSALFFGLAEQYYAGVESISPDPREPKVNVWFPGGKSLVRVEVPRDIYNPVMCMRCCEASLELAKEQPAVSALWVAANFRREARLGLNVQSDEPAQTEDLTRLPDFPRSIYFARSAGPDVCRLVLSRGVRDRDRDVALGSIAALAVTAGPAAMTTMTGPESTSLVEALQFPDLLVRIKAALAVGKSMPPETFRGADDVVRVLAGALALTGKQHFVLVDGDAAARDALATALAQRDATVVAAARLDEALTQAERELPHVDAILLASDLKAPNVIEAARALTGHERFSLTPVLVYVKQADNLVADRLAGVSPKAGVVFVENGNGADWGKLVDALARQFPRTAAKYGHVPFTPEVSLALALDAAATLRGMAAHNSGVFDLGIAEQPLIKALSHPSEELRIASLRVLALLDSQAAQRAIAAVALNLEASPSLRMAAFAALADSGRHFGLCLEPAILEVLVRQALSLPDLVLRTAASQALGALNPPGTSVADVILAYPSRPVLAPATQPAAGR